MRYLLCLLPPLAVLSCGRLFATLANCLFTLLFYVPGVLHALLVVQRHYADRRCREVIAAIREK